MTLEERQQLWFAQAPWAAGLPNPRRALNLIICTNVSARDCSRLCVQKLFLRVRQR
jgi:hypothetical protein